MAKLIRRISLVLMLCMCVALVGCGKGKDVKFENKTGTSDSSVDENAGEDENTPQDADVDEGTDEDALAGREDIIILYTNDIHCAVSCDEEKGVLGFEKVSGLKKQLMDEGKNVLLVDIGDAIQGDVIGTLSKGKDIATLMQASGYDVAIPGNHEFDYGMDVFLNIVKESTFPYLSCNFMDVTKNESVLDGYCIKEIGGVKLAFVGISTPYTLQSSNPGNFKDENGDYIYGFCQDSDGTLLYETVQKTVDEAKAEGADYVIALTHLGIGDSYYSSTQMIGNTTGIDVMLDGHSHSVLESEHVKNKEGKEVVLTSTGTKLANIGELTIAKDGKISSKLVNGDLPSDGDIAAVISELSDGNEKQLAQVVGHIKAPLIIEEPSTIGSEAPIRLVRTSETNLGDFVADAYRYVTGADIGIVNGGGVRANITSKDVTYANLISVQPFGNYICMVEASGQKILDSLECSARFWPEESGGFFQVSGLTYEIDTTIPSSVKVDEDNNFVSIDGDYRVGNVKVNGEPLDLNKKYTVASHNFLLKSGGDGNTLFIDCEVLLDDIMLDNQALIEYFKEVVDKKLWKQYKEPYGQGRIVEKE